MRVIGEDHRVFNNYFAELTGSEGRSALTFQQGVVNSPLNGYFQVKRALVAFNTFVRCQNNILIGLADTPSGSSQPGTLPPVDCVIANNLVFGTSGQLIVQRIAPVTTLWEGNILFGTTLGVATTAGLWQVDPALALGADGLWRPGTNSPALGAAPGTYPDVTGDMEGHARPAAKDIGGDQMSAAPAARPPLTAADVGPDWTRPPPAAPSITLPPASQGLDAGGTVHRTNVLLKRDAVPLLPEALDDPGQNWTSGGSVPWEGQTAVTHDGVDAARSGRIGHSQNTRLETYVDGPGTVSFWWKISSEPVNDPLRFYVADVEQTRISGAVDWEFRSFSVPAGSRVLLKWRYSKNSSVSQGQDRAWVDQVLFVPSAPTPPAIVTEPLSSTAGEGALVQLSVGASGTAPLAYRWRFNDMDLFDGTNVSGAAGATLTLSNVEPARAGGYSVVISNQAGVVRSTEALLRVAPTLGEVLEAPSWGFSMAGAASWMAQTNESYDGVDAARSGLIGHNENTRLETWVAGPGTVSFWWKISSEPVNDQLRFYVADVEQARISGELDWEDRTFSVPVGSQVLLKWRYSKNGSVAQGQDSAWVDAIRFVPTSPAPEAAAAPLVLSIHLDGDKAVLRWNATPGKRYRVAYKDRLAETGWKVWIADLPTNGSNSTMEAVVRGGAQGFYRVVEE